MLILGNRTLYIDIEIHSCIEINNMYIIGVTVIIFI